MIYNAYTDYFTKTVYDAEQVLIPLGVADPTLEYYSSTDSSRGVQLKQVIVDGLTDIMAGRRAMSDYDQLVRDWVGNGGDQVRGEYLAQMNASN